MKQGLQLKFGQQLSMTPQLQQAIRLLQLSSLELQQEIQQALDENPLLEVADEDAAGEVSEHTDDWDDTPCSAALSSASASSFDDDNTIYQGATEQSLQDYLFWQMRLSHFSPTDELIATTIIDSISDSGYLTCDLDDILEAVQLQGEDDIQADEVAVVLKRIQQFEPLGVGARNVRECLLIQLERGAIDPFWRDKAISAVSDHLELLGSRDYRTLARKLRLNEDQLTSVVGLIQQLNPRPGDSFRPETDDYVIPDVLVRKKNGRWIVELNPQNLPKLKVNQTYAALCSGAAQSEDMQYIRQQTQEAKWFIRSLESRSDTLLRVASAIVQRQQGFFEYGAEAMKPMVLADIADTVDMHESTISRVTTQKYMHTPRGMFELKYFFSSQLATDNGGECSSTAIRALLKKLVTAESPKKPLSDSKLAQLMADQGIQVARRTIAKYREALNIPPSSQRKRLI
ncbi:RNA polymerase factor sigma-54 [Pseudidiomarina salinarum]|uniref:RNA polymerase sigma-54 factor n=1 Tax=Pseudidiomarina salinarum TaxID=435908 RepID=A0A094L8P2_9GAMM|nr:RNA polymerase factor sigma-54 [Pseudidiomarina salinarum]KFZ31198.1 RNA polymerase factor sigma-54 [Pseudidiomarina salinarum]RUO71054.1 RNA polymerase sigma-54 factor [Pseudidiomarina salinarum]